MRDSLARSRSVSAAGRILAILSASALLVSAGSAFAGDKKVPATQGRDLFRQYCVPCHGETGGGGGMGPSIVGQQSIDLPNLDLFRTIRWGRIERGMPAFGTSFKPLQIQHLIAYVRGLQGVDVASGGALGIIPAARPKAELERIARGRDLFVGRARCIECHSIFGDGGMVAPDLTKIAKRMRPQQIRKSIENPSLRITPDYGTKEIATKDGRTIRGWYRDETPETVQLFDPEESLWTTYFKQELRSLSDSPESLMPTDLLDPLNEAERSDLMAFLTSLE